MSKITLLSFISACSFVGNCFASDSESAVISTGQNSKYAAFQEFDDQYYIGYGLGVGNATNGYKQNAGYSDSNVAFGVEKLFDMGIWLAFDGRLMTGFHSNSSNPNAKSEPVGLDPSMANLNLKVGYAFPVVKNELLVTPYGMIGRDTNISSVSLKDNMTPDNGTNTITVNSTHDYFIATGVGGRIEYRVDSVFDFYFDQNAIYNIDMSNPTSAYVPLTNVSFTSSLGAKFNVWRELQLGAQTYYTFSTLTNSIPTAQQYDFVPNSYFGGMITVGLTY